MSLTRPAKLLWVAKQVARDLRKKQTSSEKILWDLLRNRRFHGLKFLRQHPILVEDDGRETFVVPDFYCAERRVIIEVDGEIHNFRRKRDSRRRQLLEERGYRILRLTNEEVEGNPEGALRKIEEMI